jgi:hypothetical protein
VSFLKAGDGEAQNWLNWNGLCRTPMSAGAMGADEANKKSRKVV